MLSDNLAINTQGHLCFAGHDVTELADTYGTPLYLMDEARIRRNCRVYLDAFRRNFGADALPLYASKAASFKRIYEIMAEEGMGIDVVSCGEIHTAACAGYPLERAYFHSNNKTDEDIAFALERGVGCFVVDNEYELRALSDAACAAGRRQKILLRVTPGIDPHTYEAINTGMVDSKFGAAVETGQAEELTVQALGLPGVELAGYHCHVGSQVFEEDVFQRTCDIMLEFMARMRQRHGFVARELNLGGGYGVPYVEADGQVDIGSRIDEVAAHLKQLVQALDYPMPKVLMEPGRSIVADAGMTLYRAGTIKRIPGYKNYVSIDGGMTDNPRYALYGAKYTVLSGSRANEPADLHCDLVGRCCESGDIIQPNVDLPETTRRGDVIAVCTTGAYNYSMASNYNRLPRPAMVMLTPERSYLAIRRESLDDLVMLDV